MPINKISLKINPLNPNCGNRLTVTSAVIRTKPLPNNPALGCLNPIIKPR